METGSVCPSPCGKEMAGVNNKQHLEASAMKDYLVSGLGLYQTKSFIKPSTLSHCSEEDLDKIQWLTNIKVLEEILHLEMLTLPSRNRHLANGTLMGHYLFSFVVSTVQISGHTTSLSGNKMHHYHMETNVNGQ